MPNSSDLNKEYVSELERELREFEQKSEGSNKNMQMLVYPAMFAFIILAAYGFYLIQSLSSDVHNMAETISVMTTSVDKNMNAISGTMEDMSGRMKQLVVTTQSMSGDIGSMNSNTDAMVSSIGGLKSATYDMAASTNNMQRDMWSLNQNISTPLSFMNNFLPWKNNTSGPFPGSAAPLPPSYYAYPAQQPPNFGMQALPQMQQLPVMPTPTPATAKGAGEQSAIGVLPRVGSEKVNFNMQNIYSYPNFPIAPSNI